MCVGHLLLFIFKFFYFSVFFRDWTTKWQILEDMIDRSVFRLLDTVTCSGLNWIFETSICVAGDVVFPEMSIMSHQGSNVSAPLIGLLYL